MAIFGKRIRGCLATGGWLLGPQVPMWAGDSAGTGISRQGHAATLLRLLMDPLILTKGSSVLLDRI